MAEQKTSTIAKEDREGFARILEQHMHSMVNELDQLIEMHERYGDTLQKSYLYKARGSLKDGLGWFDWSRRQRHKETVNASTAQPEGELDACPAPPQM